jgi:hypothetical protein
MKCTIDSAEHTISEPQRKLELAILRISRAAQAHDQGARISVMGFAEPVLLRLNDFPVWSS